VVVLLEPVSGRADGASKKPRTGQPVTPVFIASACAVVLFNE
jgi:hypothetical protein